LFKRKNISNYSDNQLIDLFKDTNNQLVVSEFYRRYGYMVLGVCMKYVKNQQDAEDLTMILFEKLPNDITKYSIVNFKSWLYTKCKNDSLMFLRKRKMKHLVDINNLQLVNDEYGIERAEEKEHEFKKLNVFLNSLNEKQSKCLRLFYFKKKTYDEIENLTGYSYKEIKSAIQNGKRNLKLKFSNG